MAPIRGTAVVLAGLWAVGIAMPASGGFVHVLAVAAAVLLIIEFVASRRVRT